ncbi:MAG: SUMF1/EgtB/PvdO family nonheme iron enzyme [Kofleriaceae bacterium]
MAVRRPEGAALLVAGHGAPGVGAFDASAVHTLGQIGEALLATGTAWQIRRLTATAGDRYTADRPTLKRSLVELVNDPVRVAMVVLLGEIVEVSGELALVTGNEAREYPEDATLPLSWIRDRLLASKAEHLVVAISACGDGGAARWLGALGTERAHHVIAVDAPEAGNPMVDALLTGLCGDALDPRTGTVTMASLSTHLAIHALRVQGSAASETVAQPPPLAGLWDVRRSQLRSRPPRQRTDEPEDLTGSVLPGRFRLDSVVARGTFGTVYRSRQLAVERDVAIKVLHADIDPSSEDGRLFVHEIRSVGRIDHANVVRIYQADITHDGRLFFAMELLDGRDLQSLGSSGRLTRARAVELVRQLLAGLGAAHDAGLVHADIKPANAIVVSRNRNKSGERRPVEDVPAEDDAERVVLVDFGLARLRAPDRPAESAGGTPAYMAPEQLHEGRVDARSDLYSVALVLVWLTTGWRRPNAMMLAPPPSTIDDPDLAAVLARALDVDPAKRYQTANDLAAALTGRAAPAPKTDITPILPFRHLAPLTEADRGRLHGREADLAVITEHALYRRAVIYTAPSGTGKTSMLRAGLRPRLEALGIHAVYVRCRADSTPAVIAEINPGSPTIADAITQFHKHRGGKLVLILDQLEAALGDPSFAPAVLGFEQWPKDADVSVLLSVREDYLARLIARTQELETNIPIVRLPPLSLEGARTAIAAPLAEARLGIEPELLDALLGDLQRAAAAIGPEMGWGDSPAVFPPHLQLACSVLYEALQPEDTAISLALYRRLGGFDAIVGEHLDRVIESELDGGRDLIARDLFVALVTGAHERAIRPESELLSIVGAKHGSDAVLGVLEVLRSRGLLVRVRGESEPSWELVHDSLVPRVLSWIDRKDLARRRAVELLRYHLRGCSRENPSLLGRKELRELGSHPGAVEELDHEWEKREGDNEGWMPSTLVSRSKQVIRRRAMLFGTVIVAALAVGSTGFYKSYVESKHSEKEASLRDRDLGRFKLSLEEFDWDPKTLATIPAGDGHTLTWNLHVPDVERKLEPGAPFVDSWLVRGPTAQRDGRTLTAVEAHGGPAILVVERPGCTPSIIPIKHLPGYTERALEPDLRFHVPTCRVGNVDSIEIPAGEFYYGGPGVPPIVNSSVAKERPIDLPRFFIDRTEVTIAAFDAFSSMSSLSGVRRIPYPALKEFQGATQPRRPVLGLNWSDSGAYCRYLGKQLPTIYQWVKALRGGLQLDVGKPTTFANPSPRRNLPWGEATGPISINILMSEKARPQIDDVGSHAGDVSPYGVLDLGGSAGEWTSTPGSTRGYRYVGGGNWGETLGLADLAETIAQENERNEDQQGNFGQGFRCASDQ